MFVCSLSTYSFLSFKSSRYLSHLIHCDKQVSMLFSRNNGPSPKKGHVHVWYKCRGFVCVCVCLILLISYLRWANFWVQLNLQVELLYVIYLDPFGFQSLYLKVRCLANRSPFISHWSFPLLLLLFFLYSVHLAFDYYVRRGISFLVLSI